MTGAELAAWQALGRRRRGERAWLWPGLLGLAAAAALVVAQRAGGAAEARTWWALGTALASALVVMRAPFRMFWTSDATLLARLPIDGEALYSVAVRRSLRAGGQAALVMALAAGARATGDGGAAAAEVARCVALATGGGLVGALLAPPVGALAGWLVSSPAANRGLASIGGEGGAPPLIWLSLLPAAGGLVAGLAVWLCAAWATTGASEGVFGPIAVIAAGALVAAVAAVAAGRALARSSLSTATREVAALDAVKLAHVDLDGARGLESAWGALAGAGHARAVYVKDVALARRRFPLAFGLPAIGVLVMWLLAVFAGAETRIRWTVGIAAVLLAYTALLATRLWREPVERPRLLATLPLPRPAVTRAKLTVIAWRLVVLAAGALPALLR